MAMTVFERLYSHCCEEQQAMETLRDLYMDFPLGLRKVLLDWIEDQDWPDACENEDTAKGLYNDMIQMAEACSFEDKQFVISTLKRNYQDNPVNLADTVMTMLDLERRMLETMQDSQEKKQDEVQEEEQFLRNYEADLKEINDMLAMLAEWHTGKLTTQKEQKDLQEIMELSQRSPNGQVIPARQEQQQLQETLQSYTENITAGWRQLQQLLDVLVRSLLEDVDKFRRCQELEFVRAFPTTRLQNKLTSLKKWCGDLGRLLWSLIDKQSVEMEMELSALPNLRENLWSWFRLMIEKTTIMEKQPPICVKLSSSTKGKSKDFELGLCMQAARELSTNMTTQVVDVAIIAESQCKTQEQLNRPMAGCHLAWNKDKTKFDEAGSAKVLHVKVENFTRRAKDEKGGDRVCQQRFRIVVTVKMALSNYPVIEFKVLSLPFILITGANQSFDAYGAMLWYLFPTGDGAQECHNQPPFPCHAELSVGSVMEMLNAVITAISPRRPLRDDEMVYLSERLMHRSPVDMNTMITIDKFLFEKIPVARVREQFPFWKWFTAVVNLIENYLRDPWADGVIHGFIGNAGAAAKLRSREEGTFLLRFSESVVVGDSLSVCGGLVPTVVVPPSIDKSRVSSVLALGTEYFKKASLADLPTRPLTDRNSSSGRSLMLRELFDNGKDAKIALSKYTAKETMDVNTRYERFKLQMTIVPVIKSMDRLRLSSGEAGDSPGQRPLERQSSRLSQQHGCQSPSQASNVASPAGLALGDPVASPFSSHPFSPADNSPASAQTFTSPSPAQTFTSPSPAQTFTSPSSAQTFTSPSPSHLLPVSSPTSPAVEPQGLGPQGWSPDSAAQQQRNRAMGGGTMQVLQGSSEAEPMDTTAQQQLDFNGMVTLQAASLSGQVFLNAQASAVLQELQTGQQFSPADGGSGNVPHLNQLLPGESPMLEENQLTAEEALKYLLNLN